MCFPVYGIDRVRGDRYFAIDRHKLTYLTAVERANCLYCSCATGVLAFVREIAARTEQYWCPKLARPITPPHRRYHAFLEYGDALGYRRALTRMRHALQAPRSARARRGQRHER
jgi:hypothetical protein